MYTRESLCGICVDTRGSEVDLDEILEEVDTGEIIRHLLSRDVEPMDDASRTRRFICSLLGLPSWYYTDKDRMVDEILKLF